MKPGRRDRRYKILITGRELAELKRFARSMVEAFGLDRQIDNYKGTRPIGFYAQKRTLTIDKRTAATGPRVSDGSNCQPFER